MLIFHDLLFVSLCVGVFTFKLNNRNHDHRTSEALIFGHCKKDYETIMINNDSKQLGLTWLQQLHEQFHYVILHKDRLKYHENVVNVKKVDAILITVSFLKRVTEIVKNLRKTMWSNAMIPPVYILNLPNNNCEIGMEILQQVWKNKILTSYFLCIENNEVQIYTYNPFTNRAPSTWTEVQRSPMEPQWTLYHQTYHPKIECEELDFDRTKYLDGYQIVVAAPATTDDGQNLKGKLINYKDLHHYPNITLKRFHLIVDGLTKTLNMRPDLYVISKSYHNLTNTYTKYIEEISRNVSANLILSDYYLHLENSLKNSTFTRTYPLAWYVTGIATLNRGHRTFGEKIWGFYGIWTFLFTIFLLLVTFTVIWFSESRKTAFAVFEIIRLLISHSLYTRMNTLSLRIFFITILIYFLIIQATFHGHLAKFLTKPELRKHPETQEDFKDLGYTSIYNSTNVRKYSTKNTEERLILIAQTSYCLGHYLRNATSACVFDYEELLKRSKSKHKIYVSKKPIEMQYTSYPITEHWPLLNRVNWLLILLEDFGFRQWLSKNDLGKYTPKNETKAEARSNDDFHPIKLENLMFCFWILAVGLISSSFCFCVEMFICYKSKLNVISLMKNIKKRIIKIFNRIKILCKFPK